MFVKESVLNSLQDHNQVKEGRKSQVFYLVGAHPLQKLRIMFDMKFPKIYGYCSLESRPNV